jgi:crotonobetainyl-CoA:carnitine CoA-transferase CaiB-like acyl-CoA transferase
VLPAVVGSDVDPADGWEHLTRWVAAASAADAVERLQLVGTPAAVCGGSADQAPLRAVRLGEPRQFAGLGPLRVVDFSALWAGPMAAQVLARAGAHVTHVESVVRRDGTRTASPRFWRSLRRGTAELVLDLAAPSDRARLDDLLAAADVVIEASRPRALRSWGIDAHRFVAARPGRTWLSITGHGRDRHDGQWVAFGDDAAVAGGLVCRDADGNPLFCGDALADPASGLWAAAAVLASQLAGGGYRLDVAMAGVAADLARPEPTAPVHDHEVRWTDVGWTVTHANRPPQRVRAPRATAGANA